ncbi:polysaccharide pyruvyl transferase family protein [Dermabacteraceae bacterium TAE3-ERU5]|nr:polysaccharide pyruvyl transferase family protein [Dermabacteraceae bacterium TAE3-ERU5]
MKIAVLCDTDQTVYHVGDEAITHATLDALRERGHDAIPISRREKYGPGGSAPAVSLPALTFPWPEEDRERYLDEVRRVLAGERDALPAEDKLFNFIEEMRGMDALVIGGGGSLNSTYGWLLYERIATGLIAHHLGKPVVLSGQSIGPHLSLTDRANLAELLKICTLVGVRDADSYALARSLCPEHPAMHQIIDDANVFGLDYDAEKQNLVSVTLGSVGYPFPQEDYVRVMADLIDAVADTTGAAVEFVPHMADPDTGGSDVQVHAKVAALMRNPSVQRPIELARPSAQRTVNARYVVTTRFHPVVFSLASGCSVVPVTLGEYHFSRIDGALRNWGLSGGALPFATIWRDPVARDAYLREFLASADAERERIAATGRQRRAEANAWWDAVSATLSGAAPASDAARAVSQPVAVTPRFSGEAAQALAPYTAGASKPKVGIVMRTRNRPLLLDRAVRDVLAQTSQSWELVVVNDGGDPTEVERVLAPYEKRLAGRCRVLNREESTGMEAASNAGIAQTSAPYLVVHDDDDTWEPTFLQETGDYLDAHPGTQAVACRVMLVKERLVGSEYIEYERHEHWGELPGMHLTDFMTVNRMVPISVLYRREVHELIGGYREDLPVVGDYEFYLRLLQAAPVGWLERPLAHWRHRPEATGTGSNSMYADARGHALYDAQLREAHFRKWVADNGLGLPMFIARTVNLEVQRAQREGSEKLDRVLGELAEVRRQLDEVRDETNRLAFLPQLKRLAAGARRRLGR